ncbi:MAG TPA: hypothetical protein VFF30_07140 [Nitrososphaerales archaeon]|nr:hypothetical protein [Nitrososphaerales archaeon]
MKSGEKAMPFLKSRIEDADKACQMLALEMLQDIMEGKTAQHRVGRF